METQEEFTLIVRTIILKRLEDYFGDKLLTDKPQLERKSHASSIVYRVLCTIGKRFIISCDFC